MAYVCIARVTQAAAAALLNKVLYISSSYVSSSYSQALRAHRLLHIRRPAGDDVWLTWGCGFTSSLIHNTSGLES